MKKIRDLFRPKSKDSSGQPNWNQKSEENIFNKISDEQFNRLCENQSWGEIPTYENYYEPEKIDQDKVIEALEHFINNQEDYPEEFKETFKKRYRDILA